MSVIVEDSPRRCPFDGKRMVIELGQDGAMGENEMQAVHECWHCGFREVDHEWTRPIGSEVRPILASLRDRVRAGTVVPMDYDRTSLTVEQALAGALNPENLIGHLDAEADANQPQAGEPA